MAPESTVALRTGMALGHDATLNHLVGAPGLKLLGGEYLGESLHIRHRLMAGSFIAFLTILAAIALVAVFLALGAFSLGSVFLAVGLVAFLLVLGALGLLALGACLTAEDLGVEVEELGLLVGGEVLGLGHAVGDDLCLLFGGEHSALSLILLVTLSRFLCHHCGEPQNKTETKNDCSFHCNKHFSGLNIFCL